MTSRLFRFAEQLAAKQNSSISRTEGVKAINNQSLGYGLELGAGVLSCSFRHSACPPAGIRYVSLSFTVTAEISAAKANLLHGRSGPVL